VEAGGAGFMKKRERILEVIQLVRRRTNLILFAKLSPELGDVLEIAKDVMNAGADGLSLINTLKGMAINVDTMKPQIANITGGLSGPAIKPVALRFVYEVKKHLGVPVIASGGILTGRDAVEFLSVGADLIAAGTANFVNPSATADILKGIEDFCRQKNWNHIDQCRGAFHAKKQDVGTACGG
jgi:dihydroorotate dehydrogenase (NAD+) catalytic subunit